MSEILSLISSAIENIPRLIEASSDLSQLSFFSAETGEQAEAAVDGASQATE